MYTKNMSLTDSDKQWIKSAITDGVVEALNEIILPRFEAHDEKFDQIDAHFDQIDAHFDQIDAHLGRIDARFDRVENDVNTIQGELRQMHTEIADIRDIVEGIDNRLLGVESDIREIYDHIVALEKKTALNADEQKELKKQFELLVSWAKKVSEKTGVPLPKI